LFCPLPIIAFACHSVAIAENRLPAILIVIKTHFI
jgi:hypothetical protein